MPNIKGPICCADGITGWGNPDYGVMLIGQNPAFHEMDDGIPFTGSDGELINQVLKTTGWARDRVYATNSCCVRDLSRIDICYPRLMNEIELYKPRLVVTLGSTACENVFHTKLSRARGALLYCNGYRGLATWLPSAITQAESPEKQNDFAAEFVRDFKKIARYFGPGRTPPEKVTKPAIIVKDLERAQFILDTLPRNELVTIDIETPIIDKEDGDPYHKILCVGIGLEDDIQYVFPERIIDKLIWPKDIQWGGWNLYGFDMVALRDRYGIELPVVHDGMLTSAVRDERIARGTHRLKTNAREDAGADFYEEDETRATFEDLAKYNGFDVAYNYRLLKYHLHNFDEDDKKLYYNLLIPAANEYSEAQYYGCKIDIMKLIELDLQFWGRDQQLTSELATDAQVLGWDGLINPNSDQQVSKLFFEILGLPTSLSHRTKSGNRWSVDKNVLDNLNHPWAAKLRLQRQYTDTRARYITNVRAQVKHDGKVHPKCWIPGAASGRPSYSDPAVQQLPHERTIKELSIVRSLFCADDDEHEMLALDYSQIELWIMWAYSEDPNLYADLTEPWFLTGKPDYHSRTCLGQICETHMMTCSECLLSREMCACLAFKPLTIPGCPSCVKWAFDRDNQKHVNFGIPYGETAYGLMRPPPIGTGLPFKECQKLIDNWYTRNKYVLEWQRSIEYILRTKGFIKTPFGRKRRFPIVCNPRQIRQAINAPIQGTASDFTLSSMVELMPLIKPLGARLLFTTHDEILLHTPKKHTNEIAEIAKYIMEKPRCPGFPSIKTEQKRGNNLYQVSP